MPILGGWTPPPETRAMLGVINNLRKERDAARALSAEKDQRIEALSKDLDISQKFGAAQTEHLKKMDDTLKINEAVIAKLQGIIKERDALLRQAEAALNEAERQAQESNALLLTTIEQQTEEIADLNREIENWKAIKEDQAKEIDHLQKQLDLASVAEVGTKFEVPKRPAPRRRTAS